MAGRAGLSVEETRAYEIMDATTLRAWLGADEALGSLLGGSPQQWRVREVGDGNLNLVFLVDSSHGALCVKQALPYVRAAGPKWAMPAQRAFFEHAYYAAVAPHVGARIPRIHRFDPQRYCIVMECLAPHIILRRGLMAGQRYPASAAHIGEYIARASFFTSDWAGRFERRFDGIALFAANHPLVRITVDLVFTDPYCASARNRHTSPQLDATVAALRADAALKAGAARFGQKFITAPQALIHGDLHSGSVMVTDADTRVIDPEFAFYGPIGFDLGAYFGNLLLSWYSQPGHATAANDRRAYRDWILEQARELWLSFRACFGALLETQAGGDAFPRAMFGRAEDAASLAAERARFLDSLFQDMLGFAACKMIRRIVGFAHVADFETIADAALRARCERGALAMARALLTRPQDFATLDAVLAQVPCMELA